jgi:predicted methyltransferase
MMKHPLVAKTALLVSFCLAAGALAAADSPPPPPGGAMMGPKTHTPDPALLKAVADPNRTPKFVARDRFRHPAEELAFFGLKPNMTVVEIWPGGGYWTEILGPYLKASGHYYAAVQVKGENKEDDAGTDAWKAKVDKQKDWYGTVTYTALGKGHYDVAPPDSTDLIVTFRNFHNWMDGGYADEAAKGFFTALKPGGILGVEDHRGRDDKPQDPKAKSGYVRQDYTIAAFRKAGFEYVGASEINANPKDTKDYPEGVWTLPPTLTLGDKDREKYTAIGESDRYVLKFRKPVK